MRQGRLVKRQMLEMFGYADEGWTVDYAGVLICPHGRRERTQSAAVSVRISGSQSIPAWMHSGYSGLPRETATYRYA